MTNTDFARGVFIKKRVNVLMSCDKVLLLREALAISPTKMDVCLGMILSEPTGTVRQVEGIQALMEVMERAAEFIAEQEWSDIYPVKVAA